MWTRIREILLHNLGLKLASLVLALLLYAHVVTEEQRESRVVMPVVLTGLPESLAVVGRPPARVTVNVRGKWKDLIRLGLTGRQLSVDLASVTAGRYQRSLSVDDVRQLAIPAELSKLVEVTEVIEPRSIDVGIEPRRGKTVAVKARIVGAPPQGYAARGPAQVDPDTAWVTGPASVVSGLDTLFTLPVDIGGERERIHRQVPLDAGSNLLAVQPRRCIVTLRITRVAPDSTARSL
ncbi:MAG TPA: CdaR family protein [Candidatus Eisenbacteria bacterium]|nr:CdaR family protein [Candidatus Eisenbacteria bacterium]